jgi:hypothetical protein
MGALSRFTLIEGLELILNFTLGEIDRLLMKFHLEGIAPHDPDLPSFSPKSSRLNRLLLFLQTNPNQKGPFGANLGFELLEHVIDRFLDSGKQIPARLVRALEGDGYVIAGRSLKPIIPSPQGPAVIQSELLDLLGRFEFGTATGHLEQAIAAHSRGEWASANAQIRTFTESLLDQIAKRLDSAAAAGAATSEERRRLLATMSPPFLLDTLNEWDLSKGKGFLQGFWRRLHPEGSHPGLSDENDSTFRLHLVQLIAHHLMRRLEERLRKRGAGSRGV